MKRLVNIVLLAAMLMAAAALGELLDHPGGTARTALADLDNRGSA